MQYASGILLPPVQKLVATIQFSKGKLAIESLIRPSGINKSGPMSVKHALQIAVEITMHTPPENSQNTCPGR